MKYAPFGATTYLYTNPEVMNGRFPGQWFQLETGLAYNWHRHYDPTIGRYLQPDPLDLKALLRDGPSIYAYVRNNILSHIDLTGLQSEGSSDDDERDEKEPVEPFSACERPTCMEFPNTSLGGTYSLRDPETDEIVRTGRTNNFCRREKEHARDPVFSGYKFTPEDETDDYKEQRGLEQMLHEIHKPALNKINPISPINPDLPIYIDAAKQFLSK